MKITGAVLLGTLGTASSAFTPRVVSSCTSSKDVPSTTALFYIDKNGAAGAAESEPSFRDRIGAASAAAMAAAVNQAVAMKKLEAPSNDKSYVALDTSQNELDEEGKIPLQYFCCYLFRPCRMRPFLTITLFFYVIRQHMFVCV